MQGLPSSHMLAAPDPHLPPLQVSFSVQPSPSSHAVASTGANTQPMPSTQLSLVQGFLSSQTLGE